MGACFKITTLCSWGASHKLNALRFEKPWNTEILYSPLSTGMLVKTSRKGKKRQTKIHVEWESTVSPNFQLYLFLLSPVNVCKECFAVTWDPLP